MHDACKYANGWLSKREPLNYTIPELTLPRFRRRRLNPLTRRIHASAISLPTAISSKSTI